MVRKAVIPVAGHGTRFLPITKSIPKEMLPIVDKPNLQYIVEEAINSGIEEILIVSCHEKPEIEEYFTEKPELEEVLENAGKLDLLKLLKDLNYDITIDFAYEDTFSGNGMAIKMAKDFVDGEPFAVMFGDDLMMYDDVPVLKQLIDIHDEYGCNVVAAVEVEPKDVSSYGIMKLKEGTNIIETFVEKPKVGEAPSNYAGVGRYILNPEVFDELDNQEAGSNGEYQLTLTFEPLMKYQEIRACAFEGTYYNIGSKLGYLKANVDYALKREDLKEFKTFLENKESI